MMKILVVDDSALARRMVRKVLEPAGYEVIEAENGNAALEQYGLERPDAVTLDLGMDGMSGWEVLARLRELDPRAAVVIVSADVQRESQIDASNYGARGYVAKPFTTETILSALHAARREGCDGHC